MDFLVLMTCGSSFLGDEKGWFVKVRREVMGFWVGWSLLV